jgi:hypothetical protein
MVSPLVTKRQKNAIKITEQNDRGSKKEQKQKSHIFCNEPSGLLWKKHRVF